ncbi:MAG: molecular chaperone DnaJ [Caulobacter sp.]|nr:molecular chaperone DnaJ [Caulobacter sp.]
MIYLLLGLAAFALLVWAGRRARPVLARPEWRIAAGTLSALALIAGGLLGVTGRVLPGVVLAGAGLVLAMTARRAGLPPPSKVDNADLAEAREILGVAVGATREEIQTAYGRLIRAVHPDAGGTSGLAARLNAARDRLLKK